MRLGNLIWIKSGKSELRAEEFPETTRIVTANEKQTFPVLSMSRGKCLWYVAASRATARDQRSHAKLKKGMISSGQRRLSSKKVFRTPGVLRSDFLEEVAPGDNFLHSSIGTSFRRLSSLIISRRRDEFSLL
jgi:hypothetical protein